MKLSSSLGIACFVTALSNAALAAPIFAPAPPTRPHLKAYGDWAALWWQWAVGTPAANNPVLDTTGANCAVNQPVPGVFFLAGSFSSGTIQRSCTVPVGTSFLIPMLNDAYFAQQTDPPAQRTEAFVRSQVTCVEQSPNLALSVDGVALANPKSYLEKSTLFSVNLPPDNVFGVPPQLLSPSADEGYYGFVEPLTPGAHTVHIASSSGCGVTEDVTYTLNVQGTVGTPITCAGSQQIVLNNADIQTTGAAITVAGNCNITINNSVLWGGTAGIVIHDQGHVVVNGSVVGGGSAFVADGHGHGEYRNSAVISPVTVTQFAVVSNSGGNVAF
ncbi:MAG TPA: hypothetical protein VLJ38_05030 [Polyangiaceae bacterium]|nr:hypothetical protein [Polyangiaceae bacterium]